MAGKILVVDDDPDTITYLRTLLTQQGYTILSAENGMQALKLADSEQPDLIILDVMMAYMDGYEVARSLRRNPETSLIPIMMFTAKTQVQDKIAGYEAGVDFYLTKPVHPVELQASIKALMTQRQESVTKSARLGYMVGVMAGKGGLGVSTLALNLAIAYAQKTAQKVIAAELRPGQGTWADELKLKSPGGITSLLRLGVPDITLDKIEGELTALPSGVRLLLASDSSKDSNLMTSMNQMEAVLTLLPQMADLVILDIGTGCSPSLDAITEHCNEIILTVEPQPIAIQKTRRLLEELRTRRYGSSKALSVVMVNRVRADMSLSMSQVEETLGQSVTMGIPPAAEQAFYAATNGKPLIAIQPEGIVAQQFAALADLISKRVPK